MKNTVLLQAAYDAWAAAAPLRTRRRRFKRYTYGDQWGDPVADDSGRTVTEGQLLASTGRQPLTNNLIRRLVKTVVGRFRNLGAQNGIYAGAMKTIAVQNELPDLDSRLLEEFLISGIAVQRVTGTRGRVTVSNVDPARFFVNDYRDPRGRDVRLIGMLHDLTVPELLQRFGRGDARHMDRLRRIYGGGTLVPLRDAAFAGDAAAGMCRVAEVWTLDAVERKRGRRCEIDFVWNCRWLAPDGTLLAQMPAPWAHAGHPFAFRHYPMTDGEVHPFVEDVIDQQRYINRLIVMIDRMMGSAAKGVLLFPVDQKLGDFSWDEIRRRWSASDGIIPIAGRGNLLPQQVTGGGNDVGAHRLLELQLKLFEDVSGVSNALMGEAPAGNGGSALYESQVANGTIALADLFDTFGALLNRRDALALGL